MKKYLPALICVLLITFLAASCSSKKEDLACTVAIESDDAEILAPTSVSFADGSSVLDVTKKAARQKKLQMESSGSGLTAYVSGIDNLYEFDKGPESGWIYYVNGKQAKEGCGSHKVSEGDEIKWVYVLETPPMEQ